MKVTTIAVGLATVGISIAIAPAASAISLVQVVPYSYELASSGNTVFARNYGSSQPNTVRSINATTGTVTNSAFFPGTTNRDIAASGNNLFVAKETLNSPTTHSIFKYDITNGATSTIASGLIDVNALGVDGNYLYISKSNNAGGTAYNLLKYDLTTGALVYSTPLANIGGGGAQGLAFSGNKVFVSSRYGSSASGGGAVMVYDATTGAVINSAFISGLQTPQQMAISGNSLFVAQAYNTGGVREYDATTGAVINAAFAPVVGIQGGLTIVGDTLYVSTNATQGYSIPVTSPSTSVPEPFTIIGTLIGGTAAIRMRKKLKADSNEQN